jgi:hypothetical protein
MARYYMRLHSLVDLNDSRHGVYAVVDINFPMRLAAAEQTTNHIPPDDLTIRTFLLRWQRYQLQWCVEGDFV